MAGRKRQLKMTMSRSAFVQDTAVCRFCRSELDAVHYTGRPTFPLHRDGLGSPCEGSGAMLDQAAVGHHSPAANAANAKLKPELANSRMPSFYEKDDDFELGF